MIEVLVISISRPLKIGLYENSKLIKIFEDDGKTSDVLPSIFDDILKKYKLEKIYYVNSPGSYMAIKVAYIFLKSLAITRDIEFYAASGFHFNENSPIKALGKKYFMNNNGEIIIDFLEENSIIQDFKLPEVLEYKIFTSDTLPIYNLPAV